MARTPGPGGRGNDGTGARRKKSDAQRGPSRNGKASDRAGRPEHRSDSRIDHKPQHARDATARAKPSRRGPSPKSAKGPGGKIPPPPVIRDEVEFERIEDEKKPRRRRREANAVDVSGVKFSGVASSTAKKLSGRLEDAAIAFQKERFKEADELLASIQKISPSVAEVHELRGLVHYRMGRWENAIKELQSFARLTGSVDQHPVWADCCRARRRWSEVEDLWLALGDASPTPELVEEGRIVYAGSLADQKQLDAAIAVLEKGPKAKRKPKVHHFRRWYVLADLYERSGDMPRARRLFARIIEHEPEFGDADERLEALG